MSIRYICDKCGVKMRTDEAGRLRQSLGDLVVEAIYCWKGEFGGGHVCHGCIRDAFLRGEVYKRGGLIGYLGLSKSEAEKLQRESMKAKRDAIRSSLEK